MNKMTPQQKYDFVRFILPRLPLREFSGMKCAIAVRESWGIDIDYHVYSEVLDVLHSLGHAEIIGHNADGMTLYTVKAL